MARIRTIKPEFWSDEKLAPLAPVHRLVFLGLISQADDAGRLVDNIRLLDGLLFPETDDSCAESLAELARLKRIIRYTSDSGQRLIQVTTWDEHQKVKNPSAYTLPGPSPENGSRSGGDSTEILTPRSPIPDPLSTINDQRPPTDAREASVQSVEVGDTDAVTAFADAWPEAIEILKKLKHKGGKDATASTIRQRILYPDGAESLADPSVKGIPLTERQRIFAAALVEYWGNGEKAWDTRNVVAYMRRLRGTPGERERADSMKAHNHGGVDWEAARSQVLARDAEAKRELESGQPVSVDPNALVRQLTKRMTLPQRGTA